MRYIVTVMDMHSGGYEKGVGPDLEAHGWMRVVEKYPQEKWAKDFYADSEEGAENQAHIDFAHWTDRSPYDVTCDCCGYDWSFIAWTPEEFADYYGSKDA